MTNSRQGHVVEAEQKREAACKQLYSDV